MTDQEPEPDFDPGAAPEPRRSIFEPEPAAAAAPGPVPVPAEKAVVRRGGTPLGLTVLVAAALGGGLYWTWSHPKPGTEMAVQADPRLGEAVQSVQSVEARVDALEKRPVADAGEALAALSKRLDDVSSRVDALSAKQDQLAAEAAKSAETLAQRPAPGPAPGPAAEPPPDHTAQDVPGLMAQQQAADAGRKLDEGLAQQKAALEQSQTEQKAALDAALDALAQRVDRMEQASAQAAAAQKAQAGDSAVLETVQQRLAKMEQATAQGDEAAQKAQAGDGAALDSLGGRVTKLEQGETQSAGAAKDATRAIRIAAAATALEAGQALGDLPGAPAALTRFATAAPPTEGALRAGFPAVAEAARVASEPDTANRSFLDRALARVQQSVVVRRGDHVIVGDPAAGVLARAQAQVAAGDLKGAADALASLHGPAADAVADWVGKVRALLEARAALATLAAHS